MSQKTGTGKYERLLERCKTLAAIPTAVAHPCEESALAGAVEAAQAGLIEPILVGPAARIEQTAKSANIDLGKLEIVDAEHSLDSAKKAVELVKQGRAEVLMKGSLHSDELLSAIVSFACLGTSNVTVKLPVSLGFQTMASFVRPCGAMWTSLVTSSPLDVRKTTEAEHSRGSVLSIVKGIRTDLPTTANVGASTLRSSTSGNRCGLPTGTVNTGTLANRSRTAASTGGSP